MRCCADHHFDWLRWSCSHRLNRPCIGSPAPAFTLFGSADDHFGWLGWPAFLYVAAPIIILIGCAVTSVRSVSSLTGRPVGVSVVQSFATLPVLANGSCTQALAAGVRRQGPVRSPGLEQAAVAAIRCCSRACSGVVNSCTVYGAMSSTRVFICDAAAVCALQLVESVPGSIARCYQHPCCFVHDGKLQYIFAHFV
jgi:hypothetical protein